MTLPNSLFDPQLASDLYNRYHEEYQVADEAGFDGIMINEHHTAPFCMQASINITGAVLAKITKRVKILMLGSPLPVVDNPLRLAEELAMIDCISRGRLISGFVRGGGVESLANNVNPAYNRERFEEAHDLIIAAWTRPGPVPLGGQALPVPRGQSVGAAAAEAPPADHGAGHRQSRDRHLGGAAPLSVRRARLVAGADHGADRAVPRDGGRVRATR